MAKLAAVLTAVWQYLAAAVSWLYTPQNIPSAPGQITEEDLRRWVVRGITNLLTSGIAAGTVYLAHVELGLWVIPVMWAWDRVVDGAWRFIRSIPSGEPNPIPVSIPSNE